MARSIHCRDGKWWASPQARPILVDGRHAIDEHGKTRWQQLADFRSRDLRNNWSHTVVAAFHELHAVIAIEKQVRKQLAATIDRLTDSWGAQP